MNDRLERVRAWAGRTLPNRVLDIAPASADASFRAYFRVRWPGGSAIVMDAPPAHEDCRPFVRIAGALAQLGLNVPRVLAADIGAGLLLLSDLGDTQYLDKLGDATADRLYGDALDALARLALGGDPASGVLPPYDDALLLREMNLFRDWFLVRHLGLTLDGAEHALLDTTFALLSEKARAAAGLGASRLSLAQPDGLRPHDPGVLDFGDAVIGAVTYDLVSLLRDAYIDWPDARVAGWVESTASASPAACWRGRCRCLPARFRADGRASLGLRHLRAAGLARRQAPLSPTSRACSVPARRLRTPSGTRRARGASARARGAGAGRGDRLMRAMIPAAGRGERMRPLTDLWPEAPARSRWALADRASSVPAGRRGLHRVVINLGHLGHLIPPRSTTAAATAAHRLFAGTARRAGQRRHPARARPAGEAPSC